MEAAPWAVARDHLWGRKKESGCQQRGSEHRMHGDGGQKQETGAHDHDEQQTAGWRMTDAGWRMTRTGPTITEQEHCIRRPAVICVECRMQAGERMHGRQKKRRNQNKPRHQWCDGRQWCDGSCCSRGVWVRRHRHDPTRTTQNRNRSVNRRGRRDDAADVDKIEGDRDRMKGGTGAGC